MSAPQLAITLNLANIREILGQREPFGPQVSYQLGGLTMPVADQADRLKAEEADLVARIATGDDDGRIFTELYKRYEKRLFRFGFQALGDRGLAGDMVQETFVKLWLTAGRFDAEKSSVSYYLYVIARSVAADIRKRPSSRPLPLAEDPDMPPEPDNVDQIIDSMIVREALESISPNHAQVLEMTHREGLTQSQIAKLLGLPLGTVKTRIFHGMRAMRAALIAGGYSAV